MRVTPLFLDSDPYSRFDIGVFGEAEYPHGHLPYIRHRCAMAILGGYLYVIGGSNTNRSRSSSSNDNSIGKTVDRLNLSKVCFCRPHSTKVFYNDKLKIDVCQYE